jgi:alpha-glucosidase
MKNRTHEGTPLPGATLRRSPLDERARSCGPVLGVDAGRETVITFEHGSAVVRFHPGGILRMTLSRIDAREPEPSFAVVGEPEALEPHASESGDHLTLSAGGLSLRIARASGDVELFRDPGDSRFATVGGAFQYNRRVMGLRTPLGRADHLYGLGEKTGHLDKRGRVYEMWNADEPTHFPTQDPLYVTVPFFVRSDPHGAVGTFLDEPARSWFDMGKTDPMQASIAAGSSRLDLYLIVADQVSGVVERYTALTGRMDMPPAWALGFQQSRYSYVPDERAREVARTMREKEIPCDAIYLDIDYMDEFRVFTWDPVQFPDPARLAADLDELGMRIVTILDPGVKLDPEYHAYRSGLAGDHFCRRATGEIYEGAVWAGRSAFPDFTRAQTREWWAGLHEPLLARGVAGIWNDMNEPADFSGEFYFRPDFTPPEDVTIRPDGLGTRALERYHNVYGHAMCRATAAAFERFVPTQRPFVLTRAAYAGTQRYAAVWTGDNHSWWEHLAMMIPMTLNMGISGFPFVGADVGGFQADATPELYARWVQAASLMPFFRAHSARDTGPHEPWSFGSEVEQIARYYVELRYSLLPYLYGLFAEAGRHGTPVVRPVFWHDPEDERAGNLNDEFLLGRELLVAPVLAPGVRVRSVYLPAGEWYDFWTGERLEGPIDIVAQAPLERMPLYVRAPAVLPTAAVGRNAEDTLAGRITLHLYPGAQAGAGTARATATASRRLYHDDGVSTAYRDGSRTVREARLTASGAEVSCAVADLHTGYEAAPRRYAVLLHDGATTQEAEVAPGPEKTAQPVVFGRG